jgi:shikimate dehydrogenase
MIKTKNESKLFGIIGTPVEHSLSPRMHAFMANSLGIDMSYELFDVKPEKLHTTMENFKKTSACGFNITAPHKIEIIKELDEVLDDALCMNSVNTIVNRNGKWTGYNTDGDGFCISLLMENCEIKGKNILVIGAGGAARGVCYKLAEYGARSISITARTKEKIHIIGEMIKKYSKAEFYSEMDKTKKYDIIINTTPLGMHPYEDKNPCDFMDIIDENTVCCDLIYNPRKTVFLKETEQKNAKIINGLGMLIMQGILAFEKFHDVQIDHKKYYEELNCLLADYKI